MTTQHAHYTAPFYQEAPVAEQQALTHLNEVTRAVRASTYADPLFQMQTAANRLAQADFDSTNPYTELLDFQTKTTRNADCQQLAHQTCRDTTGRTHHFAYAITNPTAAIPAVKTLHRLSRDDLNTRIKMLNACRSIYADNRLSR